MRKKKGFEYLLDQYKNKSKSGGFFSLLPRYRDMFFTGQIHHMNYSSLLDHSVMNVPGRSAKEINDYFLRLIEHNQGRGSGYGA